MHYDYSGFLHFWFQTIILKCEDHEFRGLNTININLNLFPDIAFFANFYEISIFVSQNMTFWVQLTFTKALLTYWTLEEELGRVFFAKKEDWKEQENMLKKKSEKKSDFFSDTF